MRVYQNQGCRHFMKSAINELASEFKCLQSSRLSHTQSTNTLKTLETTQGHISHEEVTYGLDAVNKIEDRTQEQENVKTPQTVVDIELHKPAVTDESGHTARCNTIFVQIYMDAPPGVPGVSKNQIYFFTNKTVEFLR